MTGGGESVSDNVFRDDEDQKDYSVEDESYEESSQQEKEQVNILCLFLVRYLKRQAECTYIRGCIRD